MICARRRCCNAARVISNRERCHADPPPPRHLRCRSGRSHASRRPSASRRAFGGARCRSKVAELVKAFLAGVRATEALTKVVSATKDAMKERDSSRRLRADRGAADGDRAFERAAHGKFERRQQRDHEGSAAARSRAAAQQPTAGGVQPVALPKFERRSSATTGTAGAWSSRCMRSPVEGRR